MTVSQINQQYFEKHQVSGNPLGSPTDITGEVSANLCPLRDKFEEGRAAGGELKLNEGGWVTRIQSTGNQGDGVVDISFENQARQEIQHVHVHFGPERSEVTTIVAGVRGDFAPGLAISDDGDKFMRLQEIKSTGEATTQDFYFTNP